MFGRVKQTGFEPYYHQIIEQIPSALIICHDDFSIRFVNAAARNLITKYLPNLKLYNSATASVNIDQVIPNFRRLWTDRKNAALATGANDTKTNKPATPIAPTLSASPNLAITGEIGGLKCDISVSRCDDMSGKQNMIYALTVTPSMNSSHPADNVDLYALLDNLPHNVMF